MNPQNEIDPRLMKKLTLLQISPERNPENEKTGITSFIQEAQEYAKVVTTSENRRHNQWMYVLQSIFMTRRKEQSPMFSTLATIVLIVSLVLGGGGATVAAAQNSQPDQLLYGVKVLSEDVRLGLSTDLQSEYQLALEFTSRRSEEIQTMAQGGTTLPESVQIRYQNQVEQAIQFAVNLPDGQAVPALQQVQTRLQTQQQALLNGTPQAEAALLKTRQMLQERLQWVQIGLQDPASLREQFRQRDQRKQDGQGSATPQGPSTTQTAATTRTGNGNTRVTGTPAPGSGYGPGNRTATCENCTPTVNGNPWTTGTPTPGSSYGPGTVLTPTANGNPWTTGTPTPGSGYGPGPQPTQQQNQPTQVGSQPTQQQNQPTQAGSQPTQQQNQPTQAGPKATQGPQSTSAGPGSQPTAGSGGPGGKR